MVGMRFISRIVLTALLVFPIVFAASAAAQEPNSLRPIALVDLPGIPGFDEVVFANGQLVLTHNSANTVDIVDPTKRRLVAQIKNVDSPRGLAVDAAGGGVYSAAAGGKNTAVVGTARRGEVGGIGGRELPLRI